MEINQPKANISEKGLVVIGTFLSLVYLGLMLSSFGAFFKPLSDEFGWTRGDTSGAFSTAMIMSGLMAIVAGRMADKFSPRWVIIICGALMGCACLLLSQIHNLYQLFLFFGILAGSGMSTMIPTTSLIARIYKKRRGLMTGITISGTSFGAVAAAPFSTWLINAFNWRIAYIILGLVVLGITSISLIFLRDPVKENSEDLTGNLSAEMNAAPKTNNTPLKAFSSGLFWAFGMILFCVGFAQSVINVHIIPHAIDSGIAPMMAAGILSAMNLASVVGNFTSGRINDIIGGRLSMLVCMVIIVSAMGVMLISGSMLVFYVVAVLTGLGFGGAVTLRSTMVAELFGLRSHGLITGTIMFIYTIGCATGPLIVGYIFDISNRYQPAFMVALSVCVVGLVMACLLKLSSSSKQRAA
jgi:MFS family permease